LFELCERFNLRFIVIADRFPSSRTVEELKDRYYYSGMFIMFAFNVSFNHGKDASYKFHPNFIELVYLVY
jgi:hypothetical protein